MKLRRRQLPDHLRRVFAAFRDVLDVVEPAKATLTGVMPTTRMPGRSLPDALLEFEEKIARRLREDAPELGGFEGLIWAVEELLTPLDGFATAAERFRELGAR